MGGGEVAADRDRAHVSREELRQRGAQKVQPHGGESLDPGGTVDLGVAVEARSGDGGEGAEATSGDDPGQGRESAHGEGVAAVCGVGLGKNLQRDHGETGLVEGQEEVAVVAGGLEGCLVARRRPGHGLQEGNHGSGGAVGGDGGESGGEELGAEGGLGRVVVAELRGGKVEVECRKHG